MRLFTKCLYFFIKFAITFAAILFIMMWATSLCFGEIGVNKTVGWAWDLNNYRVPLALIFISVYTTIFILRIKTNSYFTVISVLLLLACYLFINNVLVFTGLFVVNILMLLTNILYSLWLKARESN